jgi:hypothetical protein
MAKRKAKPATSEPVCAECQEPARYVEHPIIDGVCEDCRQQEECPTCEGTGCGEGYSEEDGPEECEDCGGAGVV